MFDITFYRKVHDLNKRLLAGEHFEKEYLSDKFESFRSKHPVVYNIETTNACNMVCKMCPRTTMMNRKIETIGEEDFVKIVDQLRPWSKEEWAKWEDFIVENYNIPNDGMSENHFFLYIIPQVIQLHGYGDPLLDRNIGRAVNCLSERGFKSYFSCNPSNINIKKTVEMFENGLDYIKYSIESVDDKKHKEIRGISSNFSKAYAKILQLLELKKERNYETTIVITMIDLNNEWQDDEFQKLRDAFEGKDVYLYLKSEDQQWYRKNYHGTESIHWSEICKHPWMSMTVKSNAEIAMCMEDYNNEIILGNLRDNSLADIWNGQKYMKFRKDHMDNSCGLKCTERCDMEVVGNLIK